TVAVVWAVLIWLVAQLLSVSWWLLPAKALLWLAWPVVLWQAGIISEEEKQWARTFARTIGEKFGFFQPLPPTPSPGRRGGGEGISLVLLPLSASGRGPGGGV